MVSLTLKHILFSGIIAVIVVTTAAHIRSNNYESCLVKEMRGLPNFMYSNVLTLCQKRYGKEVGIPLSEIDISWSFLIEAVEIEINQKDRTYKIASGQFSFSPKACDESESSDFSSEREGRARAGIIKIEWPDLAQTDVIWPHCMRTNSLTGTYR